MISHCFCQFHTTQYTTKLYNKTVFQLRLHTTLSKRTKLLHMWKVNAMASHVPILITTASFLNGSFNSCNIEDNVQVFSVHWGALMTKTDLTFPVFSIVDFAVQFYLCCKFSICDVRFKFYNGMIIFPLIKESFATCSIQWVCFLLYRQYIIFVFGKGLVFNFEINKHLIK